MTIYAIVNNLIGHEPGASSEAVWSILSPSGILQGGNPYFVPDFADRFEARTAVAIRIGRLGKGIVRRFAYRYVEAVAPAVLFMAPDLLGTLRSRGLPWTQAISYDRCLALGRFEKVPYDEIPGIHIGLLIKDASGTCCSKCDVPSRGLDIGTVIERLSHDNTLKTGDIILAGIASEGPEALPKHSASLLLNDMESLRFNIR